MAAKTTTFADTVLNTYLVTPGAFIALYTATGEVDTTGTGYARASVAALTGFTTPVPVLGVETTSNVVPVTYLSATLAWGTITEVHIFDALTGGNELYSGALTASKTVDVGDTVSFAAGALAIGES